MTNHYTKEEESYLSYLMTIEDCSLDCLAKLYNSRFPNNRRTQKALSMKVHKMRKKERG